MPNPLIPPLALPFKQTKPLKTPGLRELVVDGRYSLVLEFVGPLEWDKWEPFQAKFESFFGPGITATLAKTDAGVDVFLTSDGSGSGRGGEAKKDVLPPLMPGLKARQQ